MNLYEAISRRRSIRRYKKDKVSEQLLQNILMFSRRAVPLEEDILVKIEIEDNTRGDLPVKGFSKVDAPYYLVLFTEDKKGYSRNAGYIMEQLVLYLTAKGLGSCYLGGAKVIMKEPEGMIQAAAVAFGHPKGLLYRDPATAKRLPLKELCVFKEEVDETMKTVLKAGRLAPSAMNSQPWRFIVYKNRIYIFACKGYLPSVFLASIREFNMGIMFSHLMLAAEEMWLNMNLEIEDQIMKKVYKSGEYVATAAFRAF